VPALDRLRAGVVARRGPPLQDLVEVVTHLDPPPSTSSSHPARRSPPARPRRAGRPAGRRSR
jgi:hypothetical protein